MSGNTFGHLFRFTTFGESHGKALGVVLDGFPQGIKIDEDILRNMLQRRLTGQSTLTTQRKEKDEYTILSGVFEGVSTGQPIALIVYNTDQKSQDYSDIKDIYRPGHADFTYDMKYGIRDYRGGGRSSGRETLSRVIAGAFSKMALDKYSIKIDAGVVAIGRVQAEKYEWNPPFLPPLYAPECKEKELMLDEIENARNNGDSLGSIVECRIKGVPVGLGEPVFDKLDAQLSSAIFSLGGVKAFEIGSGFNSSLLLGSENNDEIRIKAGKPVFLTNNAGGILGGISNGEDIVFKAYFKPTPSISKSMKTITKDGKETEIVIKGRHDPVIGIRAAVTVEAMAASVILDYLLLDKAYKDF